MVASDLHVISPELWEESPAFAEVLSTTGDRIVRHAPALLSALSRAVARESPDFLLITGDLTFNGARASHEMLASALRGIEELGIEVYVLPGNHDLENPWAARFTGQEAQEVPSVSVSAFRTIYAEFGFAEARARATDSLAYTVEVAPGLVLAALDSNVYERNAEKGYPDARGAISRSQHGWLTAQLERARATGDGVITAMHHSLLSHRDGGYHRGSGASWIEMWPRHARLLWDYAAPVTLTGHVHVQDIAGLRGETGEWIYDVATGSLASYPHPYRIITITDEDHLQVRSGRLSAADLPTSPRHGRARRFRQGSRNDSPPPDDRIDIDLVSGGWRHLSGAGAGPER
jgi:3',5'-cyclic AMP phosphodiesterase CpdA